MIAKKQCIAMLLAGGQGSRLGVLTKDTAKPAIPFGGKYRLIDFPLSNCANSDIDVVGVLTQYQPLELNSYIGSGMPWDLDRLSGGAYILPPYVRGKTGTWYKGSASAIYQNLGFIEQFDPEYVLILSGDHIYKMDYSKVIDAHKRNKSDLTICGIEVPWEEASRFGVMMTEEGSDVITGFEEKPKKPRSNLASMGVYVFSWKVLREYLMRDEANPKSAGDFGKDVIPAVFGDGLRVFAYRFEGYWRDVGTIDSLWDANMDLLGLPPIFDMNDPLFRIYSRNMGFPPHFVGSNAKMSDCLLSEGCEIYGSVSHSVLYTGVKVEEGAKVTDSVVMSGAHIGRGAKVTRAIIAENAHIGEGSVVGGEGDIAVVAKNITLPPMYNVACGEQVSEETLESSMDASMSAGEGLKGGA